MFQNNKVNIIFRVICLITFVVVILFVDSFITLSLLTIAFYLFTRNEYDLVLFWWHIITIIAFLVSCFMNNYYFLKLVLVFGLSYYFLITPYILANRNRKQSQIVLDKYFIRFKNNNVNRKDAINKNLVTAIYVTVHLFILFIAIMVG